MMPSATTSLLRPSGRAFDQLRPISLETGVTRYAEGSCLAKFGHTHVLCTASWEKGVPGWMKGKGAGWVTGEYGMLPRATHTRGRREAAQGKQSGRTQEIQRLIGRSMRSVIDLTALGENTITIDCDVVQADGGTRTASITGGFVALALACKYLQTEGVIKTSPVLKQAAAISVGLFQNHPVLDVDYPEDSGGEADMNVVMSSDGGFIEVQGTGESRPMTRPELDAMMVLAEKGCNELFAAQRAAIG
jgi:ribonuclease PH